MPPVFIVVCRDTAVAKEVHDWLANGNDSYGVSPALVPECAGAGSHGPDRLEGHRGHRGRRHQGRNPAAALHPRHRRQAGMAGRQGSRGMVGAGPKAQRQGGQRRQRRLAEMDRRAHSAGAGCALHRLGRDAGGGLGRQHCDAHRRPAPVRLAASVRAGRRARAAPQELCAQRGNPDVRRGDSQGLRRAVRADSVQGVAGRTDSRRSRTRTTSIPFRRRRSTRSPSRS